jgi:hypothetical protein
MDRLFSALLAIIIVGYSARSEAQAQDAKAGLPPFWSAAPHMGPMLPYQIDGLSEIMPIAGLNVGMSRGPGIMEIGTYFSNAYGAAYYEFAFSYRYILPMEGIEAGIYAGPNLVRHRGEFFDFRNVFGAHVGAGAGIPIGSGILFRGDMKFNVNPGTSLYVMFALEVRTPLGGGAAE